MINKRAHHHPHESPRLVVAGCGQTATGELGQDQQVAKTCPKHAQLAEYLADDASASDRDAAIEQSRRSEIEAIVNRVAVCGGHLRLEVFSAGPAATAEVFDGDLAPTGATEIAKLRRVPALVKQAMTQIDSNLPLAIKQVPQDGSDITSQFELASEYAQQLDAVSPHQLDVQILTDGVQTEGVVLNTPQLTTAVASGLGDHAPVVTLPAGSTVKIAGIGETVGSPAPASFVNALKVFYRHYCKRTGASCQIVSNFEGS